MTVVKKSKTNVRFFNLIAGKQNLFQTVSKAMAKAVFMVQNHPKNAV